MRTRSHHIARMETETVAVLRLVVDGLSHREAATELRITYSEVREHLACGRVWLQEHGHDDVSNVIRLRRALRDEGLIDGIALL